MVIVHPEYALLILEINSLRDDIASLLVEKDMLTEFVCKDIEIDYMLKIGALEYKLVVAQNNYQKNLKKLKIIEEKLAKNLKINMDSIDKKIKSEFKDKTKAEEHLSKEIDYAVEMTSYDFFDYDFIEEMSVEYFKCQKLYNPIFDIEDSEEKNKTFKKIEKYYKKQDLKKLQKLAKNYDDDEVFQDEISNLKNLKDRYEKILRELKRQIRKIKNSFPYNQKTILQDENLCRRKKDSLNKEIIELNGKIKNIENKINGKLKKI